MPPTLPWYRRWWFYLLAFAVTTGIGLFIWGAVRDWMVQRELEEYLAELDRRDPHWRLEEWYQAAPQVADPDNLVLAALEFGQQVKVPTGGRFEQLFATLDQYPHRPLNAEQLALLRTMLTGVDTRAKLDQLLRLKTGRFPTPDLGSPTFRTAAFSPNQQVRWTSSILTYQSQLWAYEGKGDDALRACRGMLHLSRCYDHEPTMIAQLICMGMQSLSVGELQRVLAQTEPSEPALAAAQDEYLRAAEKSLSAKGIRGDRACIDRILVEIQQGRYTSQELQRFMGSIPPPRGTLTFDHVLAWLKKYTGSSPFGFIPRERLTTHRYCDEILRAHQLPEHLAFQRIKDIAQEAAQGTAGIRFFGPAFHKIHEADLKWKAMLRAAAVALAAERYRGSTGSVPKDLQQLVPHFLPTVPLDPYSGKPMVWKTTDTGFIIYAVWLNRTDDDGHIRVQPGKPPTDCGLEFWDAKHRGKLPPIPLPEQEGE
jgi:hypothetical protein